MSKSMIDGSALRALASVEGSPKRLFLGHFPRGPEDIGSWNLARHGIVANAVWWEPRAHGHLHLVANPGAESRTLIRALVDQLAHHPTGNALVITGRNRDHYADLDREHNGVTVYDRSRPRQAAMALSELAGQVCAAARSPQGKPAPWARTVVLDYVDFLTGPRGWSTACAARPPAGGASGARCTSWPPKALRPECT